MEFSGNIEGKVVIVTGGTKGIGYGIALAFAKAGANVVVCSRTASDCTSISQELSRYGNKCLGIRTDVTDQESIKKLTDSVLEAYGKIDVLVNNAGADFWMPALEVTNDTWDRILNVHLKAAFFCSQSAGMQMIEQKYGKIINISSILGTIGEPNSSVYAIAKGGVNQLTKALAIEWAPFNIQVNSISPGYVATELTAQLLEDEKIAHYILRKTPLKRLGAPDEIGACAVFLASDFANYITGQVIHIDGGWTAK